MIFGNKGGMVCAYGEEGIRWRYTPRQGCTYAAPNILNADDDPELEILSHNRYGGGLVVLQPDGTVQRSEPAAPGTAATPLLGDLDLDGSAEWVIAAAAPGALSWIELGLPFQAHASNRLTSSGDRPGLVAATRPYRLLATPAVGQPGGGQQATVQSDLVLQGGVHRWRVAERIWSPGC